MPAHVWPPGGAGRRRPRGSAAPSTPDDRFFRHIVSSMRNGVIAIHRDGTLALMNDEAYRIFALTRRPDDIGRPFADVFRERPDVVRVLSGAFELSHAAEPRRAAAEGLSTASSATRCRR